MKSASGKKNVKSNKRASVLEPGEEASLEDSVDIKSHIDVPGSNLLLNTRLGSSSVLDNGTARLGSKKRSTFTLEPSKAHEIKKTTNDDIDPLNDGTKQFREEATQNVESIFEGLRKNLILMEFETRRFNFSSMRKEELTFFKQQKADTLKKLKERQEKEKERLMLAFADALNARELRRKAILHQAQLDASAEDKDALIQELDESQRMSMEIKETLDDFRDSFDELLKQTEIKHTKIRKQLSTAQERRLQDKKVLHALEVANLTEEMRFSSNKRFQFQMNHQKAMDKKVSEHFRSAQLLVIQQTKEIFEFEISAKERKYDIQALMWNEINRLTSQQRSEQQAIELTIKELQFRQITNSSVLKHHLALSQLAARHKETLLIESKTQDSREKALELDWQEMQNQTKEAMEGVEEFFLNRAWLETPASLYICEKLFASFELQKDQFFSMDAMEYSDQDYQQILASNFENGEIHYNSMMQIQDPQTIRDQLKKAEQDIKALTHSHTQKIKQLKKKLEEKHYDLIRDIQEEYHNLKTKQGEARSALEVQQHEELEQLKLTQAKERQMSESIMKSEHTMLLERKRLNLMLQRVVDGIITIDKVGTIIKFNLAAENMFGYSSNEVLGKNIKMLQPPEIASKHDQYLSVYLETGVRKVIGIGRTTHGRKKDGTHFPLSLSISEVKDDEKHIFTGILRDLTTETARIEHNKKELDKRKIEMEVLIQQLAVEKGRSADLINAILPPTISQRMLHDGEVPPETFKDVTVLFTDVAGFNELATKYSAMEIVDLLNELYCIFDEVILGYDVYKVETIGGSYICASGVPMPNKNHAVEIAKLALHFQKAIQYVKFKTHPEVEIKLLMGIHTGPLVAGIVGSRSPRYCLFGDTVNTASRMKSVSEPGKITVSPTSYQALANVEGNPFALTARGEIPVKGKGNMQVHFLEGMAGLKLSMASLKQMKIVDTAMFESFVFEEGNWKNSVSKREAKAEPTSEKLNAPSQ